MGVNFDCDLYWTADRHALLGALSILPEYLRSAAAEAGAVIDYRDWQVPLGRRFRALKLWFVLRAFGAEGVRAHIRRGIAHAELFESLVRESDVFEMACERSLALVCFAHTSGDAPTRAAMEAVNDSGEAFFTHTTLPGNDGGERFVIRFASGSAQTGEADVRRAFTALERAARGG